MIDRIVGLDLSLTCTGLAFADPVGSEVIVTRAIKTSVTDGDRLDRYTQIAKEIMMHVGWRTIVIIEDFAFGVTSKKSSLATLGELNGIIKLLVWRKTGMKPTLIGPGQWKKFLSDNGQLKQDEFKIRVWKKYKVDLATVDECVAYTLVKMGQAIILGTDGCTGYELKVLEKIRKDGRDDPIVQALANNKK